ncbi:MAG TPA: GDSL-type esterase/lipase family protein [Chloroflexota bacterium]|nr:GDSL-type esterase/lipase family protein [Chloroflexota bacterium]
MRRILTTALLGLLLLPGIAGAQTPVTNQRLFDTIPNLPELYARRVAQWEGEPVVTGRIIFLGNSITQGGEWGQLLGDSTVLNRGISGDITYGVLKRLDEITRRRPSKLFILIGINDIGKDIPAAVIADNYHKIIREVQAQSSAPQIYVQSVLPVDPDYPGFPQHYDKQHQVDRVNRLLKHVAVTTNTTYVDLEPVFLDARGHLDPRYTTDGLHLNEQGYRVWAEYLRKTGRL